MTTLNTVTSHNIPTIINDLTEKAKEYAIILEAQSYGHYRISRL